jgi:hypothetical protein
MAQGRGIFRRVKRVVKPAIVLALVVAVGAAHSAAAGTAKRRSALLLLDTNPLRVAGGGFARRERVRLRTTVNGRQLRKIVTATATGRLVAEFQVNAECWPFVLYAEGRSGSRAVLRRINIPPPCGAPITP